MDVDGGHADEDQGVDGVVEGAELLIEADRLGQGARLGAELPVVAVALELGVRHFRNDDFHALTLGGVGDAGGTVEDDVAAVDEGPVQADVALLLGLACAGLERRLVAVTEPTHGVHQLTVGADVGAALFDEAVDDQLLAGVAVLFGNDRVRHADNATTTALPADQGRVGAVVDDGDDSQIVGGQHDGAELLAADVDAVDGQVPDLPLVEEVVGLVRTHLIDEEAGHVGVAGEGRERVVGRVDGVSGGLVMSGHGSP